MLVLSDLTYSSLRDQLLQCHPLPGLQTSFINLHWYPELLGIIRYGFNYNEFSLIKPKD